MIIVSCKIENSVTSGIEAVLAANQTLHMRNCSIGSNRQHGLYAKGSTGTYNVDIDHCMFTSNQNNGVYVFGGDVRFHMTDCLLQNNMLNLVVNPNYGVVTVRDCVIGHNSYRWSDWTARISMRSYSYSNSKASTMVKQNATMHFRARSGILSPLWKTFHGGMVNYAGMFSLRPNINGNHHNKYTDSQTFCI